MALVTRYVNTASSGGDGTTNGESGASAAYASLAAWEAAEETSLLAAGDSHEVICSVGSGTAANTGNCRIGSWTTTSENRITVKAAPGEEAGYQWNDTIFRAEFGLGERMHIFNDVTMEGLQLISTADEAFGAVHTGGGGFDVAVRNCFIRREVVDATTNILALWMSTYQVEITNCIIRLTDTGTNLIGPCYGFYIQAAGSGSLKCTNNTVHVDGINSSDINTGPIRVWDNTTAENICKNNIAYSTNMAGSYGNIRINGTVTEDYNSGTEDDFTGPNSRNNQTFTFVDVNNLNYQITANDAGARGYGQNLSASLGYVDDITGVERTDPWDIGATVYKPNASSRSQLSNLTTITGLTRINL